MSTAASTGLVRVAFAASLAVAISTFAAAAWTGSSALLAAAIQALAAMSSQCVMLIGIKRTHPAAPDRASGCCSGDIYFWCYVAAALLFSMAAGVAIYDGALRFVKPQRIAEFEVAYWVASAATAVQGYAFWRAVRATPTPAAGQGLAAALRAAPNAPLLTLLAEGFAGFVGLALVFPGIALVHLAGLASADGAASMAIGLLLAAVATFLSLQVRAHLSPAAVPVDETAMRLPATWPPPACDLPQAEPQVEPEVVAPTPPHSGNATSPDAPPRNKYPSSKRRGKKKGRHRHH